VSFRLSRAVSSYLEPPGYLERAQDISGASGYLEPSQVISSRQVISSGSRLSRALQAISSRLKLSRAARLSRAGPGCLSSISGYLEAASSYLEPPGYLERAQDISGARDISRGASGKLGPRDGSRGPLRMTRSAQDDSVRYESSHTLPATVKDGTRLP
jgi:hypothetical protein